LLSCRRVLTGRAGELIDSWCGKEAQLLSESASKEILETYCLPVNETFVVYNLEQGRKKADSLGYPVVLKNNDPAHYYKSDSHGVHLALHNQGALEQAWAELEAVAGLPGTHGFTVQRMIEPGTFELHLGARTDLEFGPYIFLGMSGLLARKRVEEAVILPPLNRLLAGKLIEKSWLESCRQWLPFELEKLEEILVRITPYPNQYESHAVLRDGTKVLIRPIKPEDAEAHYAFISSFSRETSYYRFFSYGKDLADDQMTRFTQIDYDREMAIIAVVERDGRELTIGVNRLVYYAHSDVQITIKC